MFIKMRILAHEALKRYMLNRHTPLDGDATNLIYNIIAKADIDERFATTLDYACAKLFSDETADELDDIVRLIVEDTPEELNELLKQYSIVKKGK